MEYILDLIINSPDRIRIYCKDVHFLKIGITEVELMIYSIVIMYLIYLILGK